MLRKVLFTLLAVVMLPTFASAYNCWSVARSASPTTAATSIAFPATVHPVIAPFVGYSSKGNTLYRTAKAAINCPGTTDTMTVTVGVPAGQSLSSLKIDGVTKPATTGAKVITRGALINHSISAVYNNSLFLIDTTAAPNGTISPDVQVANGGSAVISIVPNTNYAISGITVDGVALGAGTTPTLADAIAAQSYTFSNVTGGHTLTATFAAVASANASIYGAAQTIAISTTATIDASGSTSFGFTPTYEWSVSPAGPTLVGTNKTATFNSAAAGTFTVTFKILNGATMISSASQTITVQSAAVANSVGCIGCHNNLTNPVTNTGTYPDVAAYQASAHYSQTTLGDTSCSGCHAMDHTPHLASNICLPCHSASPEKTKFEASKHWNNNLEYGPEFTEGAVEGQLNANESWTTKEDGSLVTCAYRCHFKPGMGPDPTKRSTGGITATFEGVTYNRPTGDSCVACHDSHKLSATFKDTCLACHSGSKHGKVPNEFFASKHWNNNLEYGPEFTEGAVEGQLNANESWTTKEDGALVTCAYRCHFKPGMGPDPTKRSTGGITYTDSLNGVTHNRPTGDACLACHDAHGLDADYQNTCLTCHSGSKHGKVPNEFFASKHWQNNLEIGDEFANQIDTTVAGGNVKVNGVVDGVLNANDSYTTTENGGTVTCAYRCHFRPGMYPAGVTPPASYFNTITKHATTYVAYSSRASGAKIVYTRPGGNACMACHNAHGLEANARSTCYTCHAGGNHGWSVKAFEKSSHYTGTYAVYDGVGGPTGEACTACHNAHSLEAAFYTMSGATNLVKLEAGCQKCHTPGESYAIYDVTGAGIGKHFVGLDAPVNVKPVKTTYVGPRSTCTDCHSHNNTINKGWAEGGHGNLDSLAFDGDPNENFKTMGVAGDYQTDPSLRNCVRCHTAAGYAQFVDSGFTNVAAVGVGTDNTSEPIVCSACHNNVDKGTLRLVNFTSQHNGGGYTARYGYKNTAVSGGQLVNTAIYLGNNKNSNVCMPCHSQRASGQEIKDLFAVGAFKQYSAGTAVYPHAAQPAAIVVGKGAYEFTTFTAPADNHSKIGNSAYMNTGSSQGSCVGCHMSFAGKTHSLEISFTGSCQKCHPASFDQAAVDAKKADFNAAVALLGNLLVQKGVTLDGINPAPERKAFDLSGGTKSNTALDANGLNAQQKMGAWFNWYLFTTADSAAFAHNPSYAKQMVKDSIDVLAHGSVTGSISDVPGAAALAALTSHPANQAAGTSCNTCHTASAADIVGCTTCHDVAQNDPANADIGNDGVRALAGEFTKRSHHITGASPTDAQCMVCHLEGKSASHMNGQVDLRNADTDAAFVWKGTEHTAMDNFCFSCHDADGAVSATSGAIHTILPAATATNPFNDTLTNSYDQVARAGVVDVKTAFNTTNASHHAVSGQRYKFRFSTQANAAAWALRNVKTAPAADQIAVGNLDLDGNAIEFEEGVDSYDPAGAEKGGHATLYEADKFVATYIPLGATENVGDNSTLHCGDCHTVGQWTAGSSTNADGSVTGAVIGAHGSANDYMLRNSLGTDAIHSAQTYVCFNCHVSPNAVHVADAALYDELLAEGEITSIPNPLPTWKAGWGALHPNVIAAQVTGYATAHAVSAFHAQCQADSAWMTGSSNSAASRVFMTTGGGHKDRIFDFVPAAGATAAVPTAGAEGGNITGIACTSCHNSGLRNGWGGIHGGNATYTDGLGRERQSYRFMPGMGNYRYAPPGGWDGKTETNPALITTAAAGPGEGKPMGGCYTNNTAGENAGYSSCAHHGTKDTVSGGFAAAFPTWPVNPATGKKYGGGTTSSPTAVEPTVREATAGNTLVTRPLKY